MIAVVDYGIGNLFSVKKAFECIGLDACITSCPKQIKESSIIVLPGVGAYSVAMQELERKELLALLVEQIRGGKPTLGICLGMQLLFEKSMEHGVCKGLSLFEGTVKRLPEDEVLPHMGWNIVKPKSMHPLFDGLCMPAYFYFVHSFYVETKEEEGVIATVDYGLEFVATFAKDNVVGVQFHPEKSQSVGLQFLKNFTRLAKCL